MPPMLPTAVLVRTRVLSLIASAFLAVAGAAVAGNADSDLARRILQAAGGRPGLVVHVGCGEGALTAALYQGGARLVHGLDPDPRNVRKAREYIRKRGMYGPVSVERLDGERLPYANGVVNLLVSEDLGGVRMREVRRVLAPEGVAYVKIGRKWTRNVKPRPGNVDEWTHFLHDASGNAVAHDEAVGPPRRLQWLAEPPHTRSHEHTPSINALVSAGGRIFYIADEGPISSVRLPPKWHVIARDAYNGVLLWQRSVATWYPHLINWGRTPLSLERRLVAVGDRVYVTLGYYEPLSALDAATGETVKVYEGTRGTEEVVWHEGMLLLAVRSVTDERIAEMRQFVRLAVQSDSPLYARESALPLVKEFFAAERKAEVRVVAVDADSGTILWSKGGAETAGLRALSLCASGNRAFYQRGQEVVCLDLRSGRRRWAASAPRLRLAWENTVICAGGKSVVALSADAGEVLWTQTPLLSNIRDAFVINGSLWLGGFKPWEGGRPGARRGPAWGPYFVTQRDLATGEVLKHIEPENPGHHHRCYLNKATDRYILGGRRGTEFIDLRTGEVLWNSFARGVCRYGVMPCNGLLYAPPHACGCYVSAKLIGFNALASDEPGAPAPTTEPPRLERGPAYDSASPETGAPSPHDWPTYRHDAQRSGRAPTAVPPELHCVWRADVGGRLTSPTIARGKVFVASVDEHRVSAVDADSGRPVWDFIADGRVDSPPTIHGRLAIFGSRDGHVYALRASDAALAWRLRAAPAVRRIVARGRLESAWPVHGSVLVRDGAAYCTAGRSSYLDGGIILHRFDPGTGKTLSRTRIYSPDPETGKQPEQFGPAAMPGARADILTADAEHVYLRDMVFDKRGSPLPEGNPHLLTLTDFLDDTWPHRSYWIFGTRCSLATGCSGRDRNLIYGRLIVFDDSAIYGYGRRTVHWSNQLQDGEYRVFAVARGDGAALWNQPSPVRARAMVLAGDVLFIAGPPAGGPDASQAGQDNRQALLVAVSASDGTLLARCPLDAPPVLDGMAVAAGRLYLSLVNGSVVCMAPQGSAQAQPEASG